MTTFNMNRINLEDVEFYTDERLDKVNVYSVTVVCLDPRFEDIFSSFCRAMKEYTCIQMIQQIADDFCRFTFVSHVSCMQFSRHLQMSIAKLERVYKCKLNLL